MKEALLLVGGCLGGEKAFECGFFWDVPRDHDSWFENRATRRGAVSKTRLRRLSGGFLAVSCLDTPGLRRILRDSCRELSTRMVDKRGPWSQRCPPYIGYDPGCSEYIHLELASRRPDWGEEGGRADTEHQSGQHAWFRVSKYVQSPLTPTPGLFT